MRMYRTIIIILVKFLLSGNESATEAYVKLVEDMTATPSSGSVRLVSQQFPRQYPIGYGSFGNIEGHGGSSIGNGIGLNTVNSGCPLCDSSVYSYCTHKMVYDACCCEYPAQQLKSPQCIYNDCSLLHAKSCYEHSLIKNCCCNNPY